MSLEVLRALLDAADADQKAAKRTYDAKRPRPSGPSGQRLYLRRTCILSKQRKHIGKIYEYDVASAYPAIAVTLPNMQSERLN